jgi:hypothetical protein
VKRSAATRTLLRVAVDLNDPLLREQVAESAYYRDRADDAAVDREHSGEDGSVYMALAWESVSNAGKRPYRTAVAEAFDYVLMLAE